MSYEKMHQDVKKLIRRNAPKTDTVVLKVTAEQFKTVVITYEAEIRVPASFLKEYQANAEFADTLGNVLWELGQFEEDHEVVQESEETFEVQVLEPKE